MGEDNVQGTGVIQAATLPRSPPQQVITQESCIHPGAPCTNCKQPQRFSDLLSASFHFSDMWYWFILGVSQASPTLLGGMLQFGEKCYTTGCHGVYVEIRGQLQMWSQAFYLVWEGVSYSLLCVWFPGLHRFQGTVLSQPLLWPQRHCNYRCAITKSIFICVLGTKTQILMLVRTIFPCLGLFLYVQVMASY